MSSAWGGRVGRDEAGGNGGGHRLRPAAHAELGAEAGDVPLHGAHAEEERLRDLAVRPSGEEEGEHLALARRERDGTRRIRTRYRGGRGDGFGHRAIKGEA